MYANNRCVNRCANLTLEDANANASVRADAPAAKDQEEY